MQAFEDLKKPIQYFALDLSREELERTLAQVPSFKYVSCHGLLGTYDDGREWLKNPSIVGRSKCIMHLGSSIGELPRGDAGAHDLILVLQAISIVTRPQLFWGGLQMFSSRRIH